MVRILFPVMDEKADFLSAHFGRAPYFAWFDIEEGEILDRGVIPNDSEHFGGVGTPPERIRSLRPDAVVTTGMGRRAINIFQQQGVAVLQAIGHRSVENVSAFIKGELTELTEGCLHARHR